MEYDIAGIDTGTEPDDSGRDGYAMAYLHGAAYEKIDGCEFRPTGDPSDAVEATLAL